MASARPRRQDAAGNRRRPSKSLNGQKPPEAFVTPGPPGTPRRPMNWRAKNVRRAKAGAQL
eukprot:633051-Pyramimonas_sp.AAC.1